MLLKEANWFSCLKGLNAKESTCILRAALNADGSRESPRCWTGISRVRVPFRSRSVPVPFPFRSSFCVRAGLPWSHIYIYKVFWVFCLLHLNMFAIHYRTGLTEPRPPSQANGGRGLKEWCNPTARWRPYRCLPLGCLFGLLFAVMNMIAQPPSSPLHTRKEIWKFKKTIKTSIPFGCCGDGLAFFSDFGDLCSRGFLWVSYDDLLVHGSCGSGPKIAVVKSWIIYLVGG